MGGRPSSPTSGRNLHRRIMLSSGVQKLGCRSKTRWRSPKSPSKPRVSPTQAECPASRESWGLILPGPWEVAPPTACPHLATLPPAPDNGVTFRGPRANAEKKGAEWRKGDPDECLRLSEMTGFSTNHHAYQRIPIRSLGPIAHLAQC